jgi:glycerophosphoryl diester phosphodiesterase
MNEPLTVVALARSVWQDFVRARRALFIYDILYKLLEVWLLVPAIALLLAVVLSQAGHIAVSNGDILAFVLTPSGLLYAGVLGTAAFALLLLEQAGIMFVSSVAASVEKPPVMQTVRGAFLKTLGVTRLGALLAALLALAFLPFILLAALTYRLLLTGHDIYFYVNDRPPVFWVAAGIGALLVLGALATATWLFVRWAFALPILLFENQPARAALRASRERVRGAGWRVGFILVGWLLGALVVGVALEAGFRLVAMAVLEHAGERPLVVILLLLVAQVGLVATWSFFLVVGVALLTRGLYLRRTEELGLPRPETWKPAQGAEKPISPWNWRLALLSLPLFLLAPLILWFDLSRYAAAGSRVLVTAHRGNSHAAPENTLAAIGKAIKSGADYAEVDVQLTADGEVVLLHDRDFKRLAGDSRRLDSLTLAEAQKLDVGSWFDPSFADQRVPTLKKVIKLARGRIKLNIELKFFGPDRRLTGAVARLLRKEDFESECIVTSFDYDALQEAKQLNPRLRTGLIVAHALGDVSRLEVEALSVRADFLSEGLVRRAHRAGKEIHVWSLGTARAMAQMIQRGADNLITSNPELAVRVRDEWASLSGTERLVLASRLLLGLEP